MKFKHPTLAALAGSLWLAVGLYLMPLGLHLLMDAAKQRFADKTLPILNTLSPIIGGLEEAALVLVAFALLVGYMKGSYVFRKTVNRTLQRISSEPSPASLSVVYGPAYLILLISMMGLGILIKVSGMPNDVRGIIDVAVGAALIQGSIFYFRAALSMSRSKKV